MTVEPCTSQLFSVLTLNLIATVVNHIFKAPTSQAVFQPKEKANFGTYFHAGRPRRCGLRLYSWRQQPACSPFEPAGGTRPSRCPWSPHTPRPAWTWPCLPGERVPATYSVYILRIRTDFTSTHTRTFPKHLTVNYWLKNLMAANFWVILLFVSSWAVNIKGVITSEIAISYPNNPQINAILLKQNTTW